MCSRGRSIIDTCAGWNVVCFFFFFLGCFVALSLHFDT